MHKAPQLRLLRLTLALGVALATLGCPRLTPREGPLGLPPDTGAEAVTLGPLASTTGCRLHTRLYRPERPRTDALVVLAHGFLRDQQHMSGLAAGLAESGIPTLTLSFCNCRFWDGRHGLNALDMRGVADAMGARRLIYAGFSAGGLSALIAARNEPRTVGVLTLDLVDERGLGEDAAQGLKVPMVALVGEPAPCNAQNQGLAVTAANPRAQVIPIVGARHCDFESPTDWLCETLCTGPDQSGEARRRLIIETSVAAVGRMLGLDQSSVGS